MSDDIILDGKNANDEKSSGPGKLESMSREDLIKLLKNYSVLKKKHETKINELTTSNTNFSQTEQQLRNQIANEQSKYSKLIIEFDLNKSNQSKLQEELNLTRQSLEDIQLQNETLKTSSQNLQDEITNLKNELSVVQSSSSKNESQKCSPDTELLYNFISTTIELFQLPMSLPDTIDNEFLTVYKNEFEQKQENFKQTLDQLEQDKDELQQRLEDLEFLSEEIKLENDDLRIKSSKYQQDKHAQEKEIDNYRRQIEDFEEQFLELQRESHLIEYDNKSQQQQSSIITHQHFDGNSDEIILQCMNYILKQIDNNNQQLTKASSTSSLLLSSDIPTLLHSIGITNCTDEDFSVPLNFESVLRLCTLLIERCRVLQYILLKNNDLITNDYDNQYVSFIQNNGNEQYKILIHKHDHVVLDTLFEKIYNGMNQTMNSNDWQIVIEKPIDQNASPYLRLEFDNFKFISDKIEQDLIELRSQYQQLTKQNEDQRHEISALEKRLLSNKSITQLKDRQIELEKQLLQQCEKTIQLETILQQENIDKTNIDQLKHIELSYNQLQEKLHIAQQLEEQLKQLNEKFNEKDLQFKRQNDLFDKLKIDYERQHFYILERDEKIRLLQLEIDEHDQFKENIMEKLHKEFEQQKSLLINATQNQEQRFSLRSKQQDDEFSNLIEKNLQLENDLKHNQQLFQEKTKQIQLLTDQITNLEKEKLEFIQNIDELKQQLKTNKFNVDKTVDANNQIMTQDTIQLQQNIENIQVQQSMNTNDENQSTTINNLQSELANIRQENEKLNRIINELNHKYEKQISDPGENIQELKEKYQKMKLLLTRLKKELQDKNYQPKQSSIDLELADYEKTIQQLKHDLTNKDKDIQDLRDELLNSTENYACLKLEINNLEQQKLQTDQRANKFKTLLDAAKKELQTAKDVELQRYHSDDYTRVLTDKLQNELDNNKLLINELSNEKQQLTDKLNNFNETNQRTINLLEQNLRIAKHDLDITKKDYDTLQDDFNCYKIRAQSVLKQHQTNQRERTPSLATKQIEYEETIEKLKNNLREANTKIEILTSEKETIEKEQTHLIEIQAKLMNESRKREQDLRKQHQTEINKIQNEHLQRIKDSQNKLETITLQNETLSIEYKEQIALMESDHEQSISFVKNQLETSRQEIEELKLRINLLEQTNIDNEKLTSNSETLHTGINHESERDSILAWSDSERQQTEGSVMTNIDHQLQVVPVNISDSDNLIEDHNTTSLSSINNKLHPIATENIELERQRLEDELNRLKLRLFETTELLNESELNNTRLNEQVTLLKDEIRRIERNMDRAESISNLEYLKNIILKFFILKSVPERLQLIPVLVTMLKLSPDEQAQLVHTANIPLINDENLNSNDSSIQPMTNGANAPSWGSYLNIW
ncbi:unnamed protein product [Adineta steineri]|uniref:GRIP domain-containing protein n=2 Tax=Adineta steineri TaxID=433720 RepID=A0A818MGI0_9BILA|nr:unnamed protein product [Adineta steineri]